MGQFNPERANELATHLQEAIASFLEKEISITRRELITALFAICVDIFIEPKDLLIDIKIKEINMFFETLKKLALEKEEYKQ